MPNGFWDRVLRVDLTTGKISEEHPGEAWFRRNIGGRAMIAHYLLSEVPPVMAFVGGTLCIVGVLITRRKPRVRREDPAPELTRR